MGLTLTHLAQLPKRRILGLLSTTILLAVFLAVCLYQLRPQPYNAYRTVKPTAPEGPYIPDPRAYEYFHTQQLSTFASGWKWDYKRDKKSFILNQTQCASAFPDLFRPIDESFNNRNGRSITIEELDDVQAVNGYIRGMVFNQQVYIIAADGSIYSRGLSVLLALNRAITSSPEPLPNIEFVFTVEDWQRPAPQWSFTRKVTDHETWLMPDFGFWSWPETKVGSYGEVQDKALEMEETISNPTGKAWTWRNKITKLLWRGALMNLQLRQRLISRTQGKLWADVKELDWHDKESTDSDLKSIGEHCQYKFLINTAGVSYSGRLKYIQNCRSVIFMHKDDWATHYTHLMKNKGSDQNFIEVERDFRDLERKIKELLADDAKAKTIADNNVEFFRERYLTPAAEACYWRRLIRSWAAVSFEPEFYRTNSEGKRVWRGLPLESFVLERRMEWDPY